MSPQEQIFEFGPFRLEAREHRLLRGKDVVPITGKAFATLKVLVQRQGSLVSKRDLMEAVWPGVAVEENNLDRSISTVTSRGPGRGRASLSARAGRGG